MKEEDSRGSLKVNDLVKLYGRRAVVNRVNLAVNGGQIVGLLGPNGAGKTTTTFYMIVGLIRAKKGQIFLEGRDITHEAMYIRTRQGIRRFFGWGITSSLRAMMGKGFQVMSQGAE